MNLLAHTDAIQPCSFKEETPPKSNERFKKSDGFYTGYVFAISYAFLSSLLPF